MHLLGREGGEKMRNPPPSGRWSCRNLFSVSPLGVLGMHTHVPGVFVQSPVWDFSCTIGHMGSSCRNYHTVTCWPDSEYFGVSHHRITDRVYFSYHIDSI